MKDFLNSKSMLTPGIAGALTMLITNTLNLQFQLPGRWIALALSFLLGTLVFNDKKPKLWQRSLLYLFNSLIIFSMAVGTNAVGRTARQPGDLQNFDVIQKSEESETPASFFTPWFDEK